MDRKCIYDEFKSVFGIAYIIASPAAADQSRYVGIGKNRLNPCNSYRLLFLSSTFPIHTDCLIRFDLVFCSPQTFGRLTVSVDQLPRVDLLLSESEFIV